MNNSHKYHGKVYIPDPFRARPIIIRSNFSNFFPRIHHRMEPVIKVRHKVFTLALMALSLVLIPSAHAGAGCDKTPKDQYASKSDGDNGFAIQINGSPRLYRPNQIYTITLKVFIWSPLFTAQINIFFTFDG